MSDGDTQGTVAALSQEIDEFTADGISLIPHEYRMLIMLSLVDVRFSLGDVVRTFLSAEDQHNLVEYYQTTYPDACVIPRDTDTDTADANFLLS